MVFLLTGAWVSAPATAHAGEWVWQIGTGSAISLSSPLTISQSGYPDISLTANYETKAWETVAPYYQIRVGYWEGDKAWELETVHHKLYLKNNPPEVQQFNISHGYNYYTVNRAWRKEGYIWRVGGGFVLTHPETIVRGLESDYSGGLEGFYISGVTMHVAVEKRFPLKRENWDFYLEVQAATSYAEVPVADGTAEVPVTAFHAHFGMAYTIPR